MWLVVLTIVSALALGLVIANIAGSTAPDADVQITTFDADSISSVATETSTDISPAADATDTAPAVTPSPSATIVAELIPTETTPTPAENVFIRETFDAPTPAFPSRETDSWSVGYVDQRYQFKLNGQTLIGASLALPVQNYRLAVDVAVVNGGAGIVFLVGQPATRYHILFSPDGAYTIEHRDDNTTTKIVDWTESPALQRTPGATNRLQIERNGDTIRFFANDQLLTSFTVPAREFEPQFGLVLSSRRGQGEATFDNLLGERLP